MDKSWEEERIKEREEKRAEMEYRKVMRPKWVAEANLLSEARKFELERAYYKKENTLVIMVSSLIRAGQLEEIAKSELIEKAVYLTNLIHQEFENFKKERQKCHKIKKSKE